MLVILVNHTGFAQI